MKNLIKNARIFKNLKIKDLAFKMNVDQASISRFESGLRLPTKSQILILSQILDISYDDLIVSWLKEKIISEIGYDDYAVSAMQLVCEDITAYQSVLPKISSNLDAILTEIDLLKNKLNTVRNLDSFKIKQALELEYTFESNRIEGNTLTLRETDLVINEGLTVSGKSMREHLEAINHQDAIEYIRAMMDKNANIVERELLSIHNLILRGILPHDAGRYRNVQVLIKGSGHTPPQPFLVAKQMEDFFIWFESNKKMLHPVILAAEMHLRLVTIHPFIDGNGRTSRLIMNLILLQSGYVIANIKGDFDSRMAYYSALENAQTTGKNDDFLMFVANIEKQGLERYLSIIGE